MIAFFIYVHDEYEKVDETPIKAPEISEKALNHLIFFSSTLQYFHYFTSTIFSLLLQLPESLLLDSVLILTGEIRLRQCIILSVLYQYLVKLVKSSFQFLLSFSIEKVMDSLANSPPSSMDRFCGLLEGYKNHRSIQLRQKRTQTRTWLCSIFPEFSIVLNSSLLTQYITTCESSCLKMIQTRYQAGQLPLLDYVISSQVKDSSPSESIHLTAESDFSLSSPSSSSSSSSFDSMKQFDHSLVFGNCLVASPHDMKTYLLSTYNTFFMDHIPVSYFYYYHLSSAHSIKSFPMHLIFDYSSIDHLLTSIYQYYKAISLLPSSSFPSIISEDKHKALSTQFYQHLYHCLFPEDDKTTLPSSHFTPSLDELYQYIDLLPPASKPYKRVQTFIATQFFIDMFLLYRDDLFAYFFEHKTVVNEDQKSEEDMNNLIYVQTYSYYTLRLLIEYHIVFKDTMNSMIIPLCCSHQQSDDYIMLFYLSLYEPFIDIREDADKPFLSLFGQFLYQSTCLCQSSISSTIIRPFKLVGPFGYFPSYFPCFGSYNHLQDKIHWYDDHKQEIMNLISPPEDLFQFLNDLLRFITEVDYHIPYSFLQDLFHYYISQLKTQQLFLTFSTLTLPQKQLYLQFYFLPLPSLILLLCSYHTDDAFIVKEMTFLLSSFPSDLLYNLLYSNMLSCREHELPLIEYNLSDYECIFSSFSL